MQNFKTISQKHPLSAYFILAYFLTWIIEIPLALQKQGVIREFFPFGIHYFAAFGPMLSAIIITSLINGKRGFSELIGRMFKWRVAVVWWLVAILPLILFILLSFAFWLIKGTVLNLGILGNIDFLPGLGILALPLWIITFGFGEETGWRGFALPRLQKNRTALSATLILGLLWFGWHIPAFFYVYKLAIAPGMLFGVLSGAIVFTWLYNSSRGSILIVALWHGVFNYTTAATEVKSGVIAAILSTVVMVWAVLIIFIFKPKNLSHINRQIIE